MENNSKNWNWKKRCIVVMKECQEKQMNTGKKMERRVGMKVTAKGQWEMRKKKNDMVERKDKWRELKDQETRKKNSYM